MSVAERLKQGQKKLAEKKTYLEEKTLPRKNNQDI